MAGAAACFLGNSAIIASVVMMSPAIRGVLFLDHHLLGAPEHVESSRRGQAQTLFIS
jgi:hypothetical protein